MYLAHRTLPPVAEDISFESTWQFKPPTTIRRTRNDNFLKNDNLNIATLHGEYHQRIIPVWIFYCSTQLSKTTEMNNRDEPGSDPSPNRTKNGGVLSLNLEIMP
jgi:hypothetical protein